MTQKTASRLWGNLLIIGGTTNGVGKEFRQILGDDPRYQKVWMPPPEAFDVTDPDSIEKFLTNHMAMGFGAFGYVFYCAGYKELEFIRNQDVEAMKEIYNVNVFGFYNVLKGLMNSQGAVRMCVITSEAAITPMRTTAAYCSSKAALEMSIKVAARELAPDWFITGVRPTVIDDTPMTDEDLIRIGELREWEQSKIRADFNNNPLGRMAYKDEVAKTALWLLYDAPLAMTGSIVEVRCGK
jgi:NAD(P)-dependent dehydrogenase (short-subunit alcohol dehydrogenase family)